jgi:hypothetical protein
LRSASPRSPGRAARNPHPGRRVLAFGGGFAEIEQSPARGRTHNHIAMDDNRDPEELEEDEEDTDTGDEEKDSY